MEEEIEGGNYRRDLQREPGAKCKAGYEVLLLFCFCFTFIYLGGKMGCTLLLKAQLSRGNFLFTSCGLRKLDSGHQTRC